MKKVEIKPKKVGEGTYGCVFKPSFKCRDYSLNYDNKVSKVMTTIQANKELKEFDNISKLEGLDKYAITSPQICKPVLDSIYIDGIKQCNNPLISKINIVNPMHSMLLYQDGGINIYNFINKIMIKSSNQDIIIFLSSLVNLLNGLIFFESKDIIHRDIKAENIVYNINSGKVKFIDFGLMIKKSQALNLSKRSIDGFAIDHSYWPPENFCRNFYSFNNFQKCNKYKNKYEYDLFLKLALDSFDLYTLALVFYQIAYKLYFIPNFKSFSNKFISLVSPYIEKDLNKRNTNIKTFKSEYIQLLKDFD